MLSSPLVRSLCTLVALSCAMLAPQALALSNSAKVPILLYHTHDRSGCGYDNNALIALQQDLEIMHANGFTVVPTYWIAEWVVGDRDGGTLPEKVVGITFDDGPYTDWFTIGECGRNHSGYTVLSDFKNAHPSLPWYSPHVASFVLASPVARTALENANPGLYFWSNWWPWAQGSGLMEIYNHGADHDHESVVGPIWDANLSANVAVGGYGDGIYTGQMNFSRIDNYQESDIQIRSSAAYISSVIGVYPDLFAYPFGQASDYLKNNYFPNYAGTHGTYAALCLGDTYAERDPTKRFCIPRFTYHSYWGRTPTDTIDVRVLAGAG